MAECRENQGSILVVREMGSLAWGGRRPYLEHWRPGIQAQLCLPHCETCLFRAQSSHLCNGKPKETREAAGPGMSGRLERGLASSVGSMQLITSSCEGGMVSVSSDCSGTS